MISMQFEYNRLDELGEGINNAVDIRNDPVMQHQFHSERDDTSHSLDVKPSRYKHREDGQHDLSILFPIHHTARTLLVQFRTALKKEGYKCMQMCQRQLLIIRLNLFDRFKKLFICKQPPKFILTITTHEFISVRTVTVSPLRSNSKFSYKQSSPNQLSKEVMKLCSLLQNISSLNISEVSNLNELDSQYKQDFYSLDATSYYMFSKMLVDGNYGLGQKMKAVNQKFQKQSKLSNIKKQDLKWLSEALNEISDDLLQGFNCSRKQLLQILTYCRKSVEQYFVNNHQQANANQDIRNSWDSDRFSQKQQLHKLIPQTLKQLNKLEQSWTTMDIMKNIFLVGLIFKSECVAKCIDQETRNHCIYLVRTIYKISMKEKTKILNCSGYVDKDYEDYIKIFSFQQQLSI